MKPVLMPPQKCMFRVTEITACHVDCFHCLTKSSFHHFAASMATTSPRDVDDVESIPSIHIDIAQDPFARFIGAKWRCSGVCGLFLWLWRTWRLQIALIALNRWTRLQLRFTFSIYCPKSTVFCHNGNVFNIMCAYSVQLECIGWNRSWFDSSIDWLWCVFPSYLLGLLAKIKCSISSSQPDLWDLGYLSQTEWLGRFLKPFDRIPFWILNP